MPVVADTPQKRRDGPLPNPLDLTGSPIDAPTIQLPKQTDFDPNRKVRKARSLRKCHDISVAEYPSVVAVKLNIYERSHDILIV